MKLREFNQRNYGPLTFFSDGLACIIKDEYRTLLSLGYSDQDAEGIVLSFIETSEGQPFDYAVAYLALALAEHEAGRLTERIKQKAEKYFESDILLKPWIDACHIPKDKRKEYEKLAMQLRWDTETNEGIFDLFDRGYAYSQTEKQQNETVKNDFIEILETVESIPTKLNHFVLLQEKEQVNLTFAYDQGKSCEKKLELRKSVIEKAWLKLQSTQPKKKRYIKEHYRYICDEFIPGDVVICKAAKGLFAGYFFAFQIFAQKKHSRYILTLQGTWYENFVALFDYLSKEHPDLKILKEHGYKNLKITKDNDIIYDRYIKELSYDKESLDEIFIEKIYDDFYFVYDQKKEAERRTKHLLTLMDGFYLNEHEKITDILSNETPICDYDKAKEEKITKPISIPKKNYLKPYTENAMTYEIFKSLDYKSFIEVKNGGCNGGGEQLTEQRIDMILGVHDNIDKVLLCFFNQNIFEYVIRTYGHRIKCLALFDCKHIRNFDPLCNLSELVYVMLSYNQRAEELWDMSSNFKLEGLSISRFTRLRDIDKIKTAPRLKHLSLECDSILALEPLIETNLETLCYSNYKETLDEDLEVFANIKTLKQLDFPYNSYSTEMVARYIAENPGVKGTSLCAYCVNEWYNDICIVGKRKPRLTLENDQQRIEKYEQKFKELIAFYLEKQK